MLGPIIIECFVLELEDRTCSIDCTEHVQIYNIHTSYNSYMILCMYA